MKLKERLKDFVDDNFETFGFSIFILLLFFIALTIAVNFDEKKTKRDQEFIDKNKLNLVEYEKCFELQNKYYCYVNGGSDE